MVALLMVYSARQGYIKRNSEPLSSNYRLEKSSAIRSVDELLLDVNDAAEIDEEGACLVWQFAHGGHCFWIESKRLG